jgi:tetratricopeptide (TPR) repeat protein
VRSERFDIYGHNGEALIGLSRRLESMQATLTEAGLASPDEALRTRVFVFDGTREAQPYFDLLLRQEDSHLAALHVGTGNRSTLLLSTAGGPRSRAAYHELVHDLMTRSGSHVPLWLSEGLAEYFSHFRPVGNRIAFGFLQPQHLRILRRRPLMPVREMLAVERESDFYQVERSQQLFYAQSWATVHTLISYHRHPMRAAGELVGRLTAGEPFESALKAVFDLTLQQLETRVRHYSKPGGAREGRVIVEQRSGVAASGGTAATASEVHAALADLFLQAIPDQGETAQRQVEHALSLTPPHPRAKLVAAKIHFSRGETGRALQTIDEVIADPQEPEVAVAAGDLLIGRSIGIAPRTFESNPHQMPLVERAAAAYAAARLLDEANVAAKAGAGLTSLILEPGSERAITLLNEAWREAPRRPEYGAWLYAALLRSERRDEAHLLFDQLIARGGPAAETVRLIRLACETDRANRLSQSGRADEAATLARELAAGTTDDATRQRLEVVAENYRRLAAASREIAEYNRAVITVNGGDLQGALPILESLLASAGDEEILASARRLHDAVRERLGNGGASAPRQ